MPIQCSILGLLGSYFNQIIWVMIIVVFLLASITIFLRKQRKVGLIGVGTVVLLFVVVNFLRIFYLYNSRCVMIDFL